MTRKMPFLALVCTACIALGAQAEETETPILDTLAESNQRIAQALFDSQGDSETKLTLDQIAELKVEGLGWGEIFRTLRADGSILGGSSNLGQVRSGHYQPPAIQPGSPTLATVKGKLARPVVITTGAGGRIVTGSNGNSVGHQAGVPDISDGDGDGNGRSDIKGRKVP